MSLSSGPLTAPLARTRGATPAGSMTRIRYVRRVPGPWSAAITRRRLLNDNGPTRFLECATPAWPAPAVARKPSPQETGRQRDDDPEGQRSRANRGARHDKRVRIARRACQCDAHLEVAGAGARTVPAGRQVLRERGGLDQRQLAVQLGVDLREPLLVRGIRHQTSSRTRYCKARCCIQRTANASTNDRHTRFHIPYFVTPCCRGR